jgi:hypothetical protein
VTVPHPKVYICKKAERNVVFTGNLEDNHWKTANWTESFQDIEGPTKPKPPYKTLVKMIWDQHYFYVGAKLEEPHLWATLKEHDAVIFHDNDFEVFIDPDGDNHNYFEYEINAYGADWDLRLPKPYRDGGPALNEWEIPGLMKKVTLNGTLNDPKDLDQSWVIELAFPWNAFEKHIHCNCPPQEGEVWRVNFSRVQWDLAVVHQEYRKIPNRPEHNWVWSPQYAIDMHRPEFWGYVVFTESDSIQNWQDQYHNDRHLLMQVYHAQKAYKEKHQRWATTSEIECDQKISMVLQGDAWKASIHKTPPETSIHIQHDSKIWIGK